MKPVRPPFAMAAALLGVLPVLAAGDQARVPMVVRAAVLPRTDLTVLAPPTLVVDRPGRRAGQPDAAATVELRAYSNVPQGLEVRLVAPEGLFRALHVQGPGVQAVLPGDGGSFAWRWAGKPGFQSPASLRLTLGFELVDGAPPGEIAWPVRISGEALAQ